MSLIDSTKKWLWSIALRKGVTALVKSLGALLLVKAGVLESWGITIDISHFDAAATAALIGSLEILRNWIKTKTGLKGI